jgi:hypothetical protein
MDYTRQQIRDAVKRLGEFDITGLLDALDAPSFYAGRVRKVVDDFVRQGEVEKLGANRFRFVREKALSKLARAWRAMLIKKIFTRRDIVRLSGASKIHIKKYFIYLKRSGFIAPVSGQGYENGIFALVDPENAPLGYPSDTRRPGEASGKLNNRQPSIEQGGDNMITEKGTLPIGVEIDGKTHRDFEVRLRLVGDSIEALKDPIARDDDFYFGVALLARQMVKMGDLPAEEITPNLILGMYEVDVNEIRQAERRLDSRLKSFRSESDRGEEGASGPAENANSI